MTREELKKVVEEVIGNNDPFWNDPVLDAVNKIISLPEGNSTSIKQLLGDKSEFENPYPNQLLSICSSIIEVCKKINIILDFGNENISDLSLVFDKEFVKKVNKALFCPNCNGRLRYSMPDGATLYCNDCGKQYINNKGQVGEEVVSSYDNNKIL